MASATRSPMRSRWSPGCCTAPATSTTSSAPVASSRTSSEARVPTVAISPRTVEPHADRLIGTAARAACARGHEEHEAEDGERGAPCRPAKCRRDERHAMAGCPGQVGHGQVRASGRSGGAAPAVLAENVRQRGRASFTRSLLAAVWRRVAWVPADRAGPAAADRGRPPSTLPGHAYAPLTVDFAATLRAALAAGMGSPTEPGTPPARAMTRLSRSGLCLSSRRGPPGAAGPRSPVAASSPGRTGRGSRR